MVGEEWRKHTQVCVCVSEYKVVSSTGQLCRLGRKARLPQRDLPAKQNGQVIHTHKHPHMTITATDTDAHTFYFYES